MHILHIISTLDPAAGGPAEGVRLLLSQTDAGWTGEVVTLDAPDAPFLREMRFPVHALGPINTVYGYHKALYSWLRRNRNRFDGFLLNGMWQYCGLATMLAAGRHLPYLVYPHGMLDPYFKRRFPMKHLKKVLYWYLVEFWVLRRGFRVLFTTETEQTLARQSFAFWSWLAAVVPYGVRLPSLSRDGNRHAFFAQVPALQGKRFLVFLGRIHQKKGCDLLIEAFCRVAGSDPELHLLMAGPDADGWPLQLQQVAAKAGYADRIHWPGILRGAAKWGAFQASEAFILPSHQENFGIAVAEALACGRPVLLSDQVNIATMIEDAGCALIEADTLAGTQRLLESWIEMPAEGRKRMSESALICFEDRFNIRDTAQKIVSLFHRAVESGRYTGRPSH